jgi:hypothetical protein
MRPVIRFTLLALLLVLSRDAAACSQCMCGTPFPAGVMGGVVPMRFTYGLEDRYLSKSNALDEGPGSELEQEHRLIGFALWRPHARLAFVGRLPYAMKQITSQPTGEVESVEHSHGLGDAELLGLVGLAQTNGERPLALGLVAGFTAPTGANELENANGERLDAHLQTGTGAWTGTGGFNLAISAVGGTWEASALGRVNGTNAHGYRYGNVLLYNAGFTSRSHRGVRMLLQLNGRSAARDLLDGGSVGENTGGTVLYAAPGARWTTSFGLVLEAAVQVPFAQALYGVQEEHTTARVSLAMAR